MSKVQLKLKLNSKVPTKVYATNGKHYMLQPGSNILNLEYNDYVSLTKALGIKTKDELQSKAAEKHEDTQKPAEPAIKQPEPKVEDVKPAEQNTESKLDEPATAEQDNHEDNTCNEDTCESATKELHEDQIPAEDTQEPATENVQEQCDTDYTTMSYNQLKSEYKKVTGKSCKLKKDEIIAFLQEHNSDVE
jgi:hypothetical protein